MHSHYTHSSAASPASLKYLLRAHPDCSPEQFNGDTKVRTLSHSSSDDRAPAERIPRSRPLHEQTPIRITNRSDGSLDYPLGQPYLPNRGELLGPASVVFHLDGPSHDAFLLGLV
ncbi:hypothetical protein PCASD_00864 [Puccinia coronata f. sp. avenae]|uniref:Uncharacterized protein n=1 Tax=Puccinia coronata f. sp. avenae TaxID=200324 RepID=A0A2N5VPF6_9BASI|nr:hypothetical protein PCASD_00864 [Puccinia coronata f. sp. avenae]